MNDVHDRQAEAEQAAAPSSPTALDALLAPLTVAELLTLPAAGRARLLRGAPGRFDGLLSLDELVGYASDLALLEHLDILAGGLARPARTETLADLPRLLAELAERGDSLRFRRIQCVHPPLRRLALEVVAALDLEASVNVYLSPAEVPFGLAPHRDPYDVLVVQLSGAKHWKLLGPEQGEALDWVDQDGLAHGNLGELICSRGDVLYLPAFVRHQVTPHGDEPSLHLALAILRQTQRSLLEWMHTQLESHGPSPALDDAQLDEAIASLAQRSLQLLNPSDAAQRYRHYRSSISYERTLATPKHYAATSARGYR